MNSPKRKIKNFLIVSALLLLFSAPRLYADAYFPASPWTKEEKYFEKISHKLGFGVLNLLTGWTAILFEPGLSDRFFPGLGKGVLYAVTNTAGGALHAATFPIPLDLPLPEGGVRFHRSEA